ncbi:2704_t:CDS:2 [Ambispora gerdemannii]|uniref:2704_t:CDS:1 n=1 Tax=Ambispora gerdemannii TaxID=144530 RepID=A0A9N8YNQ9_9GLOM|nr:2704_t:CDS:2 [Ambispora gerdemannii]
MPNHVPTEELPVLEALINVRNRLQILKRDRSINPADVIAIYEEASMNFKLVIKQLEILHTSREQSLSPPVENNRVNDVLDDVFQLLSLFFMAIGKNRESPAVYVQLSTIKAYISSRNIVTNNEIFIQQCLRNLDESGAYTLDELVPYQERLKEIAKIIEADENNDSVPEYQLKLLKQKLLSCEKLLNQLFESGSNISKVLAPTQKRLVEIKRELGAIGAKAEFQIDEIRMLQDELRKIDGARVDGKFLSLDGSIPPGQAQVIGLLEECYEDVHELIASKKIVSNELKPTYDRLIGLKSSLEKLTITHRWTIRETDLWIYQKQLSEIDGTRTDGNFYDEKGNSLKGQTVLLYLLHKCYHIVYRILSSSEPVAEALVPIRNQLQTVRRFLNEVKKWGGPFTARELYLYQMKLTSIDNLRVDGKFLDENGGVPEGQGIVMALLNECYDILFELKSDIVEET